MKVLLVGAESIPFVKIGGLADVMGTLPGELNKLGADARIMMPFHREIKEKYHTETKHLVDFYIPIGDRAYYVGIESLVANDVLYYFVDNEDMFGGPVYKGGEAEGEQYAFFNMAVCEALDRIDFVPDVIQANDWQTGMIPLLLKSQFAHRKQGNSKVIYTIHNMQYQGGFGFGPINYWLRLGDEHYMEGFSFSKSAIREADWLCTVSPTYAKEIQTAEYGHGLDDEIKKRAATLSGIVNGINVDEFNPETDKYLLANYSLKKPADKKKNREELLRRTGLKTRDDNTVVIGLVSRLVQQKGLDIIEKAADRLMKENAVFVFLGTGEPRYEEMVRNLQNRYPGQVAAIIEYANDMAHLIYAGSDLFLMPSRFEPCGISQMIAQAYGSLPIVRRTGGLNDTVCDFKEDTGLGNGFQFEKYSGEAMLRAVKRGIRVICDKKLRDKAMKNAMAIDNSFTESARKYMEMYEAVLKK